MSVPACGREKPYLNKIQPEMPNFNRKPEDICAFLSENLNSGLGGGSRRISLKSAPIRKNGLKSKKSSRKEVEKNVGKMYITMMMNQCSNHFPPTHISRPMQHLLSASVLLLRSGRLILFLAGLFFAAASLSAQDEAEDGIAA